MIAAYVRVSSDKQDTDRQEQSIGASWKIDRWFRDRDGKNPRDMPHKRVAFQQLLEAVRAGMIEKIVVDRQDRFGVKDAYQWGQIISQLRENGTTLVDVGGHVLSADDDTSILTGTLGAITSTREQKEKAHRNLTGKIVKARAGEYQGGYAPYGCDVVCFGPDGKEKWRTVYIGHLDRWKVYPDGSRERFTGKNNTPQKDAHDTMRIRPSIEHERVEWIKKIFEWYATEAISPGQIADRLNSLLVNPIFAKNWYKVLVSGILKNPAYIGLPTYNKHGGSRFYEFIGGKIQEVQRNAKMGRKRNQEDFVQPSSPEYPPIVPQETWNTVQRKLIKTSTKPHNAPNVAELWLRSFLVCGHCGAPMRASIGKYKDTTYPSYFCGTYGTYGKNNPTGCHCHRVKHDTLERIVLDYLEQTAPKIRELLKASQARDLAAAQPLIDAWVAASSQYAITWNKMELFLEDNLSTKKGNLETVYGLMYEYMKPRIEKQIADKEAEINTILDGFGGLSPALKGRANKRGEALAAEVEQLQERLVDLRKPYARLKEEMSARREAIDNALATMKRESSGRKKAEALGQVVDRIACYFRHTEVKQRKGKKREVGGKSFLDGVEITAVSGEVFSFTQELPSAQD